jgi:hypothetical protein
MMDWIELGACLRSNDVGKSAVIARSMRGGQRQRLHVLQGGEKRGQEEQEGD